MTRYSWVSYPLLILILFGCSRKEYPREKEEIGVLPDAHIDSATIILSQNGVKNAIVEAAKIERWESKDSTEAFDVKIALFDSIGVIRSRLSSKKGLLRERTARFALYGDVVGISSDSTVLETQSLFWDPKAELITTDDYVEIKRKDGSILRGWGLKADRDLKNVEIARNVSGQVKQLPGDETSGTKQRKSVVDDSVKNR